MHERGGGHCAAMLLLGCRRWLPPHPPLLWGPARGGCASITLAPHPIASVFVSVVIWGHFSQEPGAAQIKAGCRQQRRRLGGHGEMHGL